MTGGLAQVGMLRLLKVLRLTRSGRIIKRLTMTWTLHTKFIGAQASESSSRAQSRQGPHACTTPTALTISHIEGGGGGSSDSC